MRTCLAGRALRCCSASEFINSRRTTREGHVWTKDHGHGKDCALRGDPPPCPTLARGQVENFRAIWVPSSRASSPPSSENFLLTRKQGSNKSDKLEQREGVGPGAGGSWLPGGEGAISGQTVGGW